MRKFYQKKRVLITGHTGFKGSWLSIWLLLMGAEVYGYSKNSIKEISMFQQCNLSSHINSFKGNILDNKSLSELIQKIKPDLIFHLAGQAVTSEAFLNPLYTLENNILGTASLLESVRKSNYPCNLICITSDFSFLDKEWSWNNINNGKLYGNDPYSVSKTAAELLIQSYYETYFKSTQQNKVAIARASNIIGGGDWAKNRLLSDCFTSWFEGKNVMLKSPWLRKTWQHILDPLNGYLLLGERLFQNKEITGLSYNFGPKRIEQHSVKALVAMLSEIMTKKNIESNFTLSIPEDNFTPESIKNKNFKSTPFKGWKNKLDFRKMNEYTAEWYYECMWMKSNMLTVTEKQINSFEKIVC